MHHVETLQAVLISVGVLFAILMVLAINVQGEERANGQTRAAAQRLADASALTFTARVPQTWKNELPDALVFNRGVSNEVWHRLMGVYRGRQMALFELMTYDRTRHSMEPVQIAIDLVLVVSIDEPLPAMQLVPLSFGDVLADSVLGTQRIVFDGWEAGDRFSRQYNLWAEDRSAAEQVFKPEVVRWLADEPGWHFSSSRDRAVVWLPRWRGKFTAADTRQWQEFLDAAFDLLDKLSGRQ